MGPNSIYCLPLRAVVDIMDSCYVICDEDDTTRGLGTTVLKEKDENSGDTRDCPPAQNKRKRLSLGDTGTLAPPKKKMQPDPEDAHTATVHTSKKRLASTEYTVGWICALSTEYVAAQVFLDARHEGPEYVAPNDNNNYTLGEVGSHNVVIAVLPHGEYGISSATGVAKDMLHSFPNIKVGLMVGIGGGAPCQKHDIRLGDVVVSAPRDGSGGVFQYDFGKAIQGGSFHTTGFLNQPPLLLRAAVNGLEADYEINGHQLEGAICKIFKKNPRLRRKYQRPLATTDRLYLSSVLHASDTDVNCADCCGNDSSNLILRPERTQYDDNPRIHYGLIASANQVMRDAITRDKLIEEKDVLCFEMEAAGLMNQFPCLVIRGICDYSDSHKSKEWQGYAAMTAAAYAKDLLHRIPLHRVEAEERIKDVLSSVQKGVDQLLCAQQTKDHEIILNWLTPIDYAPQQRDYISVRQPNTGNWFLSSEEFQTWINSDKHTLFCPGGPGAGKTIMTAAVIDQLHTTYKEDDKIGIAYIYCDYRRQYEQNAVDMLASLVKQLAQKQAAMPECIQSIYDQLKKQPRRPSLDELSKLLSSTSLIYFKVFIVVDALDECQLSGGCLKTFLSALFKLQASTNVNIFATTRFIPEIMEEFRQSSSLKISAKDEDVQDYLAGNMVRLPSYVLTNLELQNEIKDTITRAADGMFLIVRLHFDSLTGLPTVGHVKKALRNLPSTLGETYDQAMARIEAQGEALRILAKKTLSWLVHAKRVLSVAELQHAVAIEPGTRQLDEEFVPDREILGSICAGLVTFDTESRDIRLAHYTIKEYFVREGTRWFQHAETDIARACLTYLLFDEFSGANHHLYGYAVRFWGNHACGTPEWQLMPSILHLLCDDVRISNMRLWLPPFFGISAILLAVFFRLDSTVLNLVELGYDVNDADMCFGYRVTPLMLATKIGSESAVKLLLEHGADANVLIPYAYSERFELGKDEPLFEYYSDEFMVVEKKLELNLLRRRGLMPDYSTSGRCLLSEAVYCGQESIVKLLLEHGANVEGNSLGDATPLVWAIACSMKGIIRLLLAHGADTRPFVIHLRGDIRFLNKIFQDEEILRMLLENGFPANPICYGRPLLVWAVLGSIRRKDNKRKIAYGSVAKILEGYGAQLPSNWRPGPLI
ncbi:hypothetical protein V8C26DRAFT_75563 [Trichoderma gracile]